MKTKQLQTVSKRIGMMVLMSLLTLGAKAQVTMVDGHYVDPKQGLEANTSTSTNFAPT